MTSKNYVEIASKIALDAFDRDEGNGVGIEYGEYDLTQQEFVDEIMPQLITKEIIGDEYSLEEDECSVTTNWDYLQYIDEENIELWADNEEDMEWQEVYYEKLSDYRDKFLNNSNEFKKEDKFKDKFTGPYEAELTNYLLASNKAMVFAIVETLDEYYEDLEKLLRDLNRLEIREGSPASPFKPYPSGSQVELKDGKNLPEWDVYPLKYGTCIKVELDGFGEVPYDTRDLIGLEIMAGMPEKTNNPYYPKSAQDLADHLPLTVNQEANFVKLKANIEDLSLDQIPDFDKCTKLFQFKEELTKFYVYEILSDLDYSYCDMLAQNDGYGWEIVSEMLANDEDEEAKIVEKLYRDIDWLEPNVMEELFNNRENLIDYLKDQEEDYDI